MKQIIIPYDEYLELINFKEEQYKTLNKIKELNNYDFLLDFIKEYENKLQYKDIQGRKYGEDEFKEISLPFSGLYDTAICRINERIKENIL